MANDIAKSGVLLDENGNQLIVNTRAELVWVKATDSPHYVPGSSDIRLSELLKNVVYDSHNQTIGGEKTFSEIITANEGVKVASGKFYKVVDSTSGTAINVLGSRNANETSLGDNTSGSFVGIYANGSRQVVVDSDGLTSKNIIHDAGNSYQGKVGSTNYEMMKMTDAKKMQLGGAAIDEISTKIGSNVVTVTNQYGIYSNGGVAAMGIIETGTGGGNVGKLADCSDIRNMSQGGENYVSRADGTISKAGDVLSAYGDGTFEAKPVFDANGKLLVGLLPDAALGNVMYGGTFKEGGVCTLTDTFKSKYGITSYTIDNASASTYEGVFFISQIEGIVVGQQVNKGDWLISSGSSWDKVDNNDAVTGVKGEAESTYRLGDVNITKGNIGLGNVEDTKLSTWKGSGYITTLGTITSGTWQGSAIADSYISSATAWNAKWDYNEDTIKGVKVNNATNADNDGSGNNIVNTYATKTSLSEVSTALSGGIADNSERIASLENWVASPVADKMEVSTLNVTGEVNLNGQVFSSLDGIFDLVSSGVILARHIADANVGTGKIVDGAITTAKIGNGAVTNAKIADGTIANAKLANSSLTIGSTSISLGGSSTTLAGLTSVTSTKFVGSLEGTADKAKADEDGNNIKSTYFKKSGGTISGDVIVTGTISGSLANSSNFGHINVDGVWVSDYTYNNSSTIYVPLVKTGHIITDSDSVHKQASVVVDSDGKGYVVSQLGYNVGSETYDSVPV